MGSERVRWAGITVLIFLTVGWFAGFLAMMFRPSQSPLGWLGLAGASVLIVMVLRILLLHTKN
jgi:hypothetical protein